MGIFLLLLLPSTCLLPSLPFQCGPLLAMVAHPIMCWALFGSEEAGKIIEEPFGMTREYGPNARQVMLTSIGGKNISDSAQ